MTWSVFGRDLLASVVVFLVALPLCMGIAIAAGVPPAMGLVSGIVAGLLVSAFGGSPLSVTGPAASLIVIVHEIVQTHGLAGLAVATALGGLLQIAGGLIGAAQLFRAVAPPVIFGMLAGIGVLIFAGQFHVMMDATPSANGLVNLITIPSALFRGLGLGAGAHQLAAVVGGITLATLLGWNQVRSRTHHAIRTLPSALVAVAVGTATAAIFSLPIRYVEIPTDLRAFFRFPAPADARLLLDGSVLGAAVAIAGIASAASLFSCAAVDRMHRGPRTDFDRELVWQGIANTLCGLVGGLPNTAVIVRSATNVEAGATTRTAAVLHAVWLAITVFALPWVLAWIPVATLAAVLVYVGANLVDTKVVRDLLARGRWSFGIYAATMIVIVGYSLVAGLLIGLGLSFAKLLYTFSHLEVRVTSPSPGVFDVDLYGAATFVRLPALARALEELPPDAEVHVHLAHLDYIDHACLELVADQEKLRVERGGRLVVQWSELHSKSASPGQQTRTALDEIAARQPPI